MRSFTRRDDPNAAPPSALSRACFLRLLAGAGLALGVGPGGAAAAASTITRAIPKSGETLSVVGLGTWQTFDVGPSPAERASQLEVLRLLLDGGGSVIDSSPMYGRSETVVGDLLAELQAHERAFLATKVWTRGAEAGIRQMEQSLARMRSPQIDLMQVHNLVDWRIHLPTLRRWREEGRIRYIGITHYTTAGLDALAEVIEAEPLDFVQLAYSIGVREAENRLLPLAAERDVAVLINRPYQGGGLFRAVRGQGLPDWAADFDCASWGQFFLKFILSHPAVTCVIPGTSKAKHMADNLGAGRGRLPDRAQRKRMLAHWQSL